MDDLSVFWVMTVRLVTASKLSSYLQESRHRWCATVSSPAVPQGAQDLCRCTPPDAHECPPLAAIALVHQDESLVQSGMAMITKGITAPVKRLWSPELDTREVELL